MYVLFMILLTIVVTAAIRQRRVNPPTPLSEVEVLPAMTSATQAFLATTGRKEETQFTNEND